jgi:hypothetical protein
MPIIDADAHVIENESAWDYMLESERPFKPKIVGATNGDPSVDYWFIDGRLMPRSNVEKKLPQAARDMSDLSIRIHHMDELNIDIQVIYPTIFIFPTARRPEVDLALCRSYNRWMADIVKKAPDRFRWVVVPPLLNLERVFEELKFGKAHGACGVYLRGLEAAGASAIPISIRCMKRPASSTFRFASTRLTAASSLMTFSSMNPGFASSNSPWSVLSIRLSTMGFPSGFRNYASASSKSARSGYPTRFMIWPGAISVVASS